MIARFKLLQGAQGDAGHSGHGALRESPAEASSPEVPAKRLQSFVDFPSSCMNGSRKA